MYHIRGRADTTSALSSMAVANLWMPHATQRIRVVQFALGTTVGPASGAVIVLWRTSSRGTPGTTVTPGLQNASNRAIAPPSGTVLDLASYAVQPTLDGLPLFGWPLAAVAAAGIAYPIPGPGIELGSASGLAIVTGAEIAIPVSEVTYSFLEDW